MSLLIVGTVAFDKIETPFGRTDKILGGAATYIGLSASVLDTRSGIVSVVGGDFPEDYLTELNGKGVDTSGVEIVKEGKTFFWSGRYYHDMNSRDTLITDLNVLADFEPVVPEKWKNAEILMLGNLHPNIQKSVLDQMQERPKLVVLDTMNYWMDNTWDELLEVLKQVDVLTINDEEARQLSGEYSLIKAAEKIVEMGPKILIIKKGENGALLFQDNNVFFAPALPLRDVFDPTGAGDTFAGGFVGYLTKTLDFSFENMKRAVIYGSALASFTVEKFGTEKLKSIDDKALWRRLREFKKLTEFEMELP